MNIKEFKEGDVITRNAPCVYAHNDTKDGSWTGDRLIFKGLDENSKIFFIEHTDDSPFKGDVTTISYARDAWDEGWCLYPETLWQKVKNKLTP